MDVDTARMLLQRRGIHLTKDDSLLTLVLLNEVVLKGVLNPQFPADISDMQSILHGKGIRVSNDDPVFTLLTLNAIVLHEAIDLVRRAQLKLRSKAKAAAYLKVLIIAALALGVGVFIGVDQVEPSRVLTAFLGGVLGAAAGALGMSLFTAKNERK